MSNRESIAMRFSLLVILVAVRARSESVEVVKTDGDLFPLSIIHLNDFHAR